VLDVEHPVARSRFQLWRAGIGGFLAAAVGGITDLFVQRCRLGSAIDDTDRMAVVELDTPHGPARAHLRPVERPRAALILGHGAGGGVAAPDLVAATEGANSAGVSVALVEQPYRVAGRRSPAPARQLDAAFASVAEQLLAGELSGLAPFTGGRSLGARVACRTAAATGAAGVVCLAFPLQPPQRRSASGPAPSRLPELEAVKVPVLIVQGERDPFGVPPASRRRKVVKVAGDHGLKADRQKLVDAVEGWLAKQLAGRT
jgi:predicted alpha/beta-hydrolase family hydrolase